MTYADHSPVRAELDCEVVLPREALSKIDALLRLTRLVTEATDNPDLPVSHLRMLLLVARQPGLTVGEYVRESGLSLSGVSRALVQMSEVRRQADRGPGLVKVTVNAYNRRQKNVTLTEKGQRLLESVVVSFA
jgi:DNA-binding MarR family transcriptional regulator